MATSSNQSGVRKPATPRTATKRAAKTTVRGASSTQPRTPVAVAQVLAERAVLVPVGASLLARDNLVSTFNGLATKYRTRASFEREIERYERRGATARNRFERQVRRTRTQFERELRQRRISVEQTVRLNRRRVEREVRSVREDLGRQSGLLSSRAQKLVSEAQDRLSAVA